jgi:hypothetical protein
MNNLAWAKGSKPGRNINDRTRVIALQQAIQDLDFPFSLTWVPRAENHAGAYLELHA